MTTNAYIFMWDQTGIESIIPITAYEHWEQTQLINILKEQPTQPNPINHILSSLTLRARYNSHRHYEIYCIDCAEGMDQKFWQTQWEEYPQATADLIRERGIRIYSDREDRSRQVII